MVLVFALAVGLLTGIGLAKLQRRLYEAPTLQYIWLVFAAFLPQLVIAYLPSTRHLLPSWLASILFLASLALFLIFSWQNRRLPGMTILLVGLLLNLIVILLNGGWMPISPPTASRLIGTDVLQFVDLGSRFGQKDILLLPQNTHLEFLADRFLLPGWISYKVAFSLGDVLVSLGVFWLLAHPSVKAKMSPSERIHLDYI